MQASKCTWQIPLNVSYQFAKPTLLAGQETSHIQARSSIFATQLIAVSAVSFSLSPEHWKVSASRPAPLLCWSQLKSPSPHMMLQKESRHVLSAINWHIYRHGDRSHFSSLQTQQRQTWQVKSCQGCEILTPHLTNVMSLPAGWSMDIIAYTQAMARKGPKPVSHAASWPLTLAYLLPVLPQLWI